MIPAECKKKIELQVSISAFKISIVTDIDSSKYGFNATDTYINSSFDPNDTLSGTFIRNVLLWYLRDVVIKGVIPIPEVEIVSQTFKKARSPISSQGDRGKG